MPDAYLLESGTDRYLLEDGSGVYLLELPSVLFDAVGPSSAGQAAAASSSISWSHTCSGTDRVLYVGIACSNNGATLSATYNSVSMTSLGKRSSNDQSQGFAQLFRLIAPATGSNTVLVSLASGTADLEGGSISFTGVDQTTPDGTPVTGISATSSVSVDVPTDSSQSMVVDVTSCGSTISSSGQTNRWLNNQNGSSGAGNGAGSTAVGTGSNVAMSYSRGASEWWAIVAVEVKPVAAGDATVSATTISCTTTLPSPTVQAASTVTPSVISGVTSMGAVAVFSNANVTPTTLALVTSMAAPAFSTGVNLAPSVIAGVTSMDAIAFLSSVNVIALVIDLLTDVPSVVVDVGGGTANISAVTIEAVVSIPTPNFVIGQILTPAVINGVASLPSPTIISGTGIFVTPATIEAVTVVGAVFVNTGITVSPVVIAAVTSIPAPGIELSTQILPAVIAAITAMAAPTIIANFSVMVTPETIQVVATVLQPENIEGEVKIWYENDDTPSDSIWTKVGLE